MESLKVLIVDDERLLREGLKTIIPWEEYGFSVCETAENGLEGIEKIRALHPEVAVVDIRMPSMDGLEVSRIVQEEGLETKIILLTGYSEFEYARSALRLGVKCYLLKPVEEDELIRELLSVKKEIVQERERRQILEEGSGLILDHLIQEIIRHPASTELTQRLNSEFRVGFPWESYQVLLLLFPEKKFKKEKVFSILNCFVKQEKLGVAFSCEETMGILIRDRVLDSYSSSGKSLLDSLRNVLGSGVRFALGDPCDHLTDLPLSFESAAGVSSMAFLIHEKDLLDSSDLSYTLSQESGEQNIDLFSEIISSTRSGDHEKLCRLIEDVKNELLKFELPDTAARAVYANILISVYNALSVAEKDNGNPNSLIFNLYRINEEIVSKSSVFEIEKYIEEKIQSWMQLPVQFKNNKIRPILRYISENLDKDLKLEILAGQFGYNSAYLGKLFRNCTGEYFNNYVDRLKMERAKEYIMQGCLVYEAAQKVGYTNINYFHIKFKKYTGIAPGSLKKGHAL